MSRIKTTLVAVSTIATLAVSNVYAAVPVDVTTAMTDAKDDALAIAALGLIIVIAIAGFQYMKRAK